MPGNDISESEAKDQRLKTHQQMKKSWRKIRHKNHIIINNNHQFPMEFAINFIKKRRNLQNICNLEL